MELLHRKYLKNDLVHKRMLSKSKLFKDGGDGDGADGHNRDVKPFFRRV
jgi:hypothetical protein